MDNRLRSDKIEKSIMHDELEFNFDKILQLLSKTNFIYPDTSNIKYYDEGDIFNFHNNEALPITVGEVAISIDRIAEHQFLLIFNGVAKSISEDLKEVLHLTNSTHLLTYLIEVPSEYDKIKFNGELLTEENFLNKGGRYFLIMVQGIYKNENGETVLEKPESEIQYEYIKIKYEVDASGVVLE